MEFLMSALESFPVWLQAIMALVTGATAITALTPSTADDKALNFVLKILNFLAGNIGKNRNKDS